LKAHWPELKPLPNYGIAHDVPHKTRLAPFLGGFGVTGIIIGGENGTVDGSGFFWYEQSNMGKNATANRPSLFECIGCIDIIMEDVTFANSSFWTIHPVLSNNVIARRIAILNPTHGFHDDVIVPNTDGFDPDSTSNVLFEDSYVHGNDHAIAIKVCHVDSPKTLLPNPITQLSILSIIS